MLYLEHRLRATLTSLDVCSHIIISIICNKSVKYAPRIFNHTASGHTQSPPLSLLTPPTPSFVTRVEGSSVRAAQATVT